MTVSMEILYISSTGEIVTAMPAGYPWRPEERGDKFSIVAYSGSTDDLKELIGGRYRYIDGKLLHTSLAPFTGAISENDAPPNMPVIESVADILRPDWRAKQIDVCDAFRPDFISAEDDPTFKKTREYWFNKFYKFYELPGVKAFLAAILYRDFGNISVVLSGLSDEVKQVFLKSEIFSAEDKKYMQWLWGSK